MKEKVLIRWVKKARQWVKTTINQDPKTRKLLYKQEWSQDKPKIT